MRILHTSDLHIGRTLNNYALLEDQKHILNLIGEIAVAEAVDVVIVAGDLYDRATPSADAVTVLNDFLMHLVADKGIAVVGIAGNHDSGERVGFASLLLERQRLTLRGNVGHLDPVIIDDDHGPVAFHLLPYAQVDVVRQHFPDADIRDHQSALNTMIAHSLSQGPACTRRVVVAHAFVNGGTNSDTERDLSVGGSALVDVALFDPFTYAALGHLHRAQTIGSDRVQYSGSPVKYSLSEVDHAKSVTIVDLGPTGQVDARRVPITPLRDLRAIKGTLEELIAGAAHDPQPHDYIGAYLTDPIMTIDPFARLRVYYPNILQTLYVNLATGTGEVGTRDYRNRPHIELFADFIRDMTDQDLTEEDREIFHAADRTANRHLEEAR